MSPRFCRTARRTALAVPLALLLGACQSPDTAPLTPAERESFAWLKKADANASRIEDRGTLFTSLDQNLRSWRSLTTSTSVDDVSQRQSIEEALTQQCYLNFDAILDELEHATDPEHRVIAAAALGFSRIPAPDEPGGDPKYPALHPRAVQPLLQALNSDNGALVQNALLSLGRIASPDTPRDVLIEFMLRHHDEDVRANAALALAEVVTPADAALVIPPLYAALSDPSHKVRLHAVKALGRIGDPSTEPAVINVLRKDSMPLVRACAALELGRFGSVNAIDPLIEGLQAGNALITYQCVHSLRKLTGETKLRDYNEWHQWWSECPKNPANAAKSGA